MAQTTQDWRGIVIELTDAETNNLLGVLLTAAAGAAGGAAGGIGAGLAALGIAAPVIPFVVAALVAHLAWEIPAIRAANQGQGVILTMPWPTPGVLIPSTRHEPSINQNWAEQNEGEFRSIGGDRIGWRIERGAHPDPEGVSFTLSNQTQSGWDKILVIRDGEGNSWEIFATRNASGENGLYAHQCQNGQQFTFRKPSFMGGWIDVFSFGGLGALAAQDRVTFTWTAD